MFYEVQRGWWKRSAIKLFGALPLDNAVCYVLSCSSVAHQGCYDSIAAQQRSASSEHQIPCMWHKDLQHREWPKAQNTLHEAQAISFWINTSSSDPDMLTGYLMLSGSQFQIWVICREYHGLPWGFPRQPAPAHMGAGFDGKLATGHGSEFETVHHADVTVCDRTAPFFLPHYHTMVLNNPPAHTDYHISYSQPQFTRWPPGKDWEKRGKKNMVRSHTICFLLFLFLFISILPENWPTAKYCS